MPSCLIRARERRWNTPAVYVAAVLVFVGVQCRRDDSVIERRAREVFDKAKSALVRGDHAETKRLLGEATRLFAVLDDDIHLAETSLLLGETYSSSAEFDSAVTLLAESKRLYAKRADKSGGRAATFALARLQVTREEYNAAFTLHKEELLLAEALGDAETIREFKLALIPVCRLVGDPETEHRFLKDLLIDTSITANGGRLARVHVASGMSFMHRQDVRSAVQAFQSAVRAAQRGADSLAMIESLMRLAISYERAGKTTDAFRAYTQALRLTDRTAGADRLRCEMLLRVGNTYLRRAQLSEGRKFYNAALRSAIALRNSLAEAYALLQLGACMSQLPNGSADARADYNAAAGLLEQIGLPHAQAYGQWCLGDLARVEGEIPEAIMYLRRVERLADSTLAHRDEFDVYVDCERAFHESRGISSTDMLIDLLMQSGKGEEALQVTRQRIRRSLFRTYSALDKHPRDGKFSAALSRFNETLHDYIGAEHRLAEAVSVQADSRSLFGDIHRAFSTRASQLSEKSDSLTLTDENYRAAVSPWGETRFDVKRSLHEGSTLVEYVASSRSLHVFMTTRSGMVTQLSAIERTKLLSLTHTYLSLLRQRKDENETRDASSVDRSIREIGAELYSAFFRPIEMNVPPGTRLVIVLPFDFPALPLHALQGGGTQGRFAIEQYPMRYLSDVDALALKGERMNTTPQVVTFGNQGKTEWDVEYELRSVRGFFKNVHQYFGGAASIESLQKETGDLLHIACDIHYREVRPGNSYVVLADAKPYTTARYVRFGELFGIGRFSTVVVSNLNDDMLPASVPRIFRMIGASDVIMNSGVPTRKVKNAFNELLYLGLQGGGSVEDAYRNALLSLRNNTEFQSPSAWGWFFLW